MARVSVLMPVYNASAFLREALDSVLNQTFSDFELLIINDGSIDDSESIIQSYSDKRLKYLKNDLNVGLVATLNKGMDNASGEYLIRMDSDDISTPDRFKKLVDYLDQHPEIGVCSSYIETFGADNSVWKYHTKHEDICASLLFRNGLAHAACIFRKSVFNENKIAYSAEFPHIEDRNLWVRLLRHTKFANIPEVLYKVRRDDHNVTVINRNTFFDRKRKFYRWALSEFKLPFTDDELNIHCGLGEFVGVNKLTLKLYFRWVNKLIRMNATTHFFNQGSLEKIISERNNLIFHKAASVGFFTGFYALSKAGFSYKRFRYLLASAIRKSK